jgi:hypothetical protein
MTNIERFVLIAVILALGVWASMWYNYYISDTADKIDKTALITVVEATRECSLQRNGSVDDWTVFLEGSGWKHSKCQGDTPTDCWHVYSPEKGKAVADRIDWTDTGTVVGASYEFDIYTVPSPFAVSSIEPLGTELTATSLANYYTPLYGTDIADYINNR